MSYLIGTFLVCVVFEWLDCSSVYLFFSHSGGSQALPVTKASWPATGYTGATPTTTKAKARPYSTSTRVSFEATGSQEIVLKQHP
jgi:hypothetical protein